MFPTFSHMLATNLKSAQSNFHNLKKILVQRADSEAIRERKKIVGNCGKVVHNPPKHPFIIKVLRYS